MRTKNTRSRRNVKPYAINRRFRFYFTICRKHTPASPSIAAEPVLHAVLRAERGFQRSLFTGKRVAHRRFCLERQLTRRMSLAGWIRAHTRLIRAVERDVEADRIVVGKLLTVVNYEGITNAQIARREPVELEGALAAVIAQHPTNEPEAPCGHPFAQAAQRPRTTHVVMRCPLAHDVAGAVFKTARFEQPEQAPFEPVFRVQVMVADGLVGSDQEHPPPESHARGTGHERCCRCWCSSRRR